MVKKRLEPSTTHLIHAPCLPVSLYSCMRVYFLDDTGASRSGNSMLMMFSFSGMTFSGSSASMVRFSCVGKVIRWWVSLFHHLPTLTVSLRTPTHTWWYCYTEILKFQQQITKIWQVQQRLFQSLTSLCSVCIKCMMQVLLFANLYVPRPEQWMKWKQKRH